MSQISILSTKTLTAAQRQVFIEANFDLLEEDFISIKNSSYELNTIHNSLIFSSQNAVLSLVEQKGWEKLKDKNVFCVGIKTKDLLEQYGFKVAVYMDYASELAEIIMLIYKKDRYTFFSGNLRKETLPQALKTAGIEFNEIEVYQTTLAPFKISSEEKFDGILFFSPSAVESYLKNNKIKNEICFCIGNTTATTLSTYKIKKIVVAQSPTIEEVIEEVMAYYNEANAGKGS